jgi:hypothetical protein
MFLIKEENLLGICGERSKIDVQNKRENDSAMGIT